MSTGPDSRNPLFIGGLPRTGTSLMRAILGSSPQVAMFPKEIPLWRSFSARYRRKDLRRPAVRRRLVEELVGHRNVTRVGVRLDADAVLAALDSEPAVTLGTVFEHVLRQYAQQMGRPRWGVKDTRNEFYAATIFAEFPDARMIQMVRDPRDMTVSLRGKRKSARPHIASIAYFWRRSAALARRNERAYPGAYRAVRYEDVVSDPPATVRHACEAAGIEYRPEMLSMGGQPGWDGSNSSFEDVQVEGRAISRRAVGRYLTRLPPAETWYLQRRLGRELEDWGYELQPIELSARDRRRVTIWRIEEVGWRLLRQIGLWNLIDPTARRQLAPP